MDNNIDVYRDERRIAQIIMGRFCKFGLKENKHLMWSKGGVPCIDAPSWDTYKDKIREIYIRTDKRRFRVDATTFEANKKEVNFPTYGKQYYIERDLWDISVHGPHGAFITEKQTMLDFDDVKRIFSS